MTTTVRIDEDVKKQLKIKSKELGVKQIDLINRYVTEGIQRDMTPSKTIDEIEKLLSHDAPEGDVLDKFDGLFEANESTNTVELKKSCIIASF